MDVKVIATPFGPRLLEPLGTTPGHHAHGPLPRRRRRRLAGLAGAWRLPSAPAPRGRMRPACS